MKNLLGPNWKPRLAGILTVFLPPILYAALTNYAHMSHDQAVEVSGEIMAVLAGLGLSVAKAHDVSHAPDALPCPRPVDPDKADAHEPDVPLPPKP
jgi:hypothetical protein